MAKKTTKFIVSYDHRRYAFDTVGQAADALKFFAKLKRVQFEQDPGSGKYYFTPHEDQNNAVELEEREYRERKALIGLPAPKRGTVPCTVCESVAVRPGHACGSCGTIAPLA